MYPWDVLKINETDDKKAIKKAYAKLIRKYRPDESPEEFQKINQAYKFALELILNQQTAHTFSKPTESNISLLTNQTEITEDVDNLCNAQNNANSESSDKGLVETNVDEVEEEVGEEDTEFDLGSKILDQFYQMAFAEYRIKKQMKNWSFLEQYHDIQDFQLRDSLSKEIFKRVVEYNNFQQRENGTLLLNQPMIREIAKILDWNEQWQEFEQIFPDVYAQHVFGLLQTIDTTKRSAPFFARIFGVYLEIVAIKFFVGFMGWHELNVSRELVILFIFFSSSVISSISKLNVPVIQYCLDICLFDRYMNKPRVKQKLVRMLMFHLTMIPVYMILIDEYKISPWTEISCSVVVIINMISWFKAKQLFHDWVSGTIMLK